MFIGILIIGVYGLIIGSFLNAVIWRLHEQAQIKSLKPKAKNLKLKGEDSQLSITKGRSMCPECAHRLRVYDLIPVLSWLILKGKCRDCHKPISWQYPGVELLTGAVFVASWLVLRPVNALQWVLFGLWLVMAGMLIVLAIYDLRWMILPDVVMFPAMLLAVALVLANILIGRPITSALSSVLAAALAGGAFYALAAVSKGRWMGGGDIKLVFLMGLVLGLQKILLALFLGFNVAAVVAVVLLLVRLKKRTDYIPFGPFLVGATIVAYLYGQVVINWYLNIGLQAYK